MKTYRFSVAILCSAITTLHAMEDQKEMVIRTQALVKIQEKHVQGRWAHPSEKQFKIPKTVSSDSGPVKRAGTPRPPLNRSCSLEKPIALRSKPVVKQFVAGSGNKELVIVEE
jgi:hypothetical protein